MKRKLTALAQQYVAALKNHLKRGPQASLEPARGLGQQAVRLGLETLDMARIHEEALARLEASSSRDGFISRAEIFFAEVVTPIEKTHRSALTANTQLIRANATLERRTADLAVSNRSLKQSIARRERVEESLERLQKATGGIGPARRKSATSGSPGSECAGDETKKDQPRSAG